MRSWFFSLQFRLVLAFTLVLVLMLSGVSAFISRAASRETEQFQDSMDGARAVRAARYLASHYSDIREWDDLQPVLEEAARISGQRLAVIDRQGRIVADSHMGEGPLPIRPMPGRRQTPILLNGRPVGMLVTAPAPPLEEPEPPATRIASALNSSLMSVGLAAGLAGVLLVSVLSQRLMVPLKSLSSTVRRFGEGDLHVRAHENGPSEVRELAHTFNGMAQNLQSAEQKRRDLVADVAHELRTPLSNIRGYLEAVKDGLIRSDDAIETIYQEVLHLSGLVEDLRLLSMAEAGSLRLDTELSSITEVLTRSVEGLRPRAEAKGVALSLDAPAGLPPVMIDRRRIAQVLGNLLENALAHTPRGGSVMVSARFADSRIQVTVADTGEGIPPEHLPLVFERFYRVDPSRTRATGGAGLGLTIARQLVEAHGGAIRAESTPAHGSRFIFELPAADSRGPFSPLPMGEG